MSARKALRDALVDFYYHLWRLSVLNTVLAAALVAIGVTALFVPLALVLLLALGPLAAALMHCAVTVAQTESLRLGDALTGLRLHWRRGLALAFAGCAALALGVLALSFYAGAGRWAWPLSLLVFYLLASFAVLQLFLWPMAVFEPERAFRAVLREAGLALVQRPGASIGLALVLLVVNVAGIAAAVLPFLTLTIAYSFLAAAHFALPRNSIREA